MSSNTPETQESEDLVLSFLNQDCFTDADASLSDPKLLANDDNLWDFLNNIPSVDKESFSGGTSPPWSSSSSDDNGGIHELSSSPRSCKGDSPDFTLPKREEPDADYWQYVNEDCVLETAGSSSLSRNSDISASLSIEEEPQKLNSQQPLIPLLQGVPLPKNLSSQAPLIYPHSLAALPAFPALPLFTTSLPGMPVVQPTTEPPKKKRGRKKREPCPAPSTANLVPLKPLIPVCPQTNNSLGFSEIKQEKPLPCNTDVIVKKEVPETPLRSVPIDNSKSAVVSPKPESRSVYTTSNNSPTTEAAAAALSKRQERLIKNRAAALLSRKRKREHMANLETTNETLVQENDELKIKVQELEEQKNALAHERDQAQEECQQLRRMLEELTKAKDQVLKENSSETAIEIESMDVDLEGNYTTESETVDAIKLEDKKLSKPKTTGVVLMIMFFSFALFSLPMTNYQSTIGGNYGSRATMGANLFTPSSHINNTPSRLASIENTHDTEVKTKYVKRSLVDNEDMKCHANDTQLPRSASGEEATRAMHSWLSRGQISDSEGDKQAPNTVESKDQVSMEVATFRKHQPSIPSTFYEHAYLYCANMQHFFTKQNETDSKTPNQRPRISLLSPVGGIFPPPWLTGPQDRKYLKIDLEVTGSELVDTGDSWMFPQALNYGGTINS